MSLNIRLAAHNADYAQPSKHHPLKPGVHVCFPILCNLFPRCVAEFSFANVYRSYFEKSCVFYIMISLQYHCRSLVLSCDSVHDRTCLLNRLNVTPDGMNAILRLSGGDMRRVLNIMQVIHPRQLVMHLCTGKLAAFVYVCRQPRCHTLSSTRLACICALAILCPLTFMRSQPLY